LKIDLYTALSRRRKKKDGGCPERFVGDCREKKKSNE